MTFPQRSYNPGRNGTSETGPSLIACASYRAPAGQSVAIANKLGGLTHGLSLWTLEVWPAVNPLYHDFDTLLYQPVHTL